MSKRKLMVVHKDYREKTIILVEVETGKPIEEISRRMVQVGPTRMRPYEPGESHKPTTKDLEQRAEERSQIGDMKQLLQAHKELP